MAAVSVFNSIQLLILATIMVAMSGSNVSIAYIIKACYAFLNNFGVIALMILPKLYECYKNKGDAISIRFSNNPRNSQPNNSHTGGYISGLGNVSHIDRSALTDTRRLSTKRLSDESIAEEKNDEYTENEQRDSEKTEQPVLCETKDTSSSD